MFEDRLQLYAPRFDPSHSNSPITKFAELIPRGSHVLEVGCASGVLSSYLTQHLDCSVVGVEINPQAAKLAEQSHSQVIIGDIEKDTLEKAGGPFDVITFGDVLEHLVCPGDVLSRCRSCLTEEGFVLVSIPNIAHYSVRLSLLQGRFDYQEYGLLDRTHLHFFTIRTARQMLVDTGYAISYFDIVYNVRGMRLISPGGTLEKLLKKHLTSFIGYQFIFKAIKARHLEHNTPSSQRNEK